MLNINSFEHVVLSIQIKEPKSNKAIEDMDR